MSVTLLIISVIALGVGPLIARAWSKQSVLRRGLDGFVTIGVGGLVIAHILPPSIAVGGLVALLFVVAGMILPTAIERVQHGNVKTAHAAALALAFLALSLHAMSDGVVLSLADGSSGWAFSTAFAVVLHRIPVGIAVWVVLRQEKGLKWVVWVFAIIVINTLIGFVSGAWLIHLMQDVSFAWFQAFVAGSLLHVIFHAHEHDHTHDHGDPFGHGHAHEHVDVDDVAEEGATHPEQGHLRDVGAVSGGAASSHTLEAGDTDSFHCVPDPWDVPGADRWTRVRGFFGTRAAAKQFPEVVGGLIGASLIVVLSWLENQGEHAHLHGSAEAGHGHLELHLTDISAHSEFAIERFMHLALESASWLLGGYILSVLVFYFIRQPGIPWLNRGNAAQNILRGSVYGVAMPVRACGVVPVFSSLVDRGARWGGATAFLYSTPQLRLETILFSIPLLGLPLMGIRVAAMLCISLLVGGLAAWLSNTPQPAVDEVPPPPITLASAAHQSLFRLVDDTAPWIIFGLVIAALVPHGAFEWFSTIPSIWALVIFGVLAIPLYLCATGATPVAAALLFAGVSPGAAMVFLLAGPVTVLSSFRAIRPRGGRVLATAVVVGGWLLVLLAGALTDRWFDPSGEHVASLHRHTAGTPMQWAALGIVGLLFVWSLLRQGPRAWLSTVVAGDHG